MFFLLFIFVDCVRINEQLVLAVVNVVCINFVLDRVLPN